MNYDAFAQAPLPPSHAILWIDLGGKASPLSFGYYDVMHTARLNYYPGQKNCYIREIHEVDLEFNHVISCDIELRFDIDATRGICASRACVADRSRC